MIVHTNATRMTPMLTFLAGESRSQWAAMPLFLTPLGLNELSNTPPFCELENHSELVDAVLDPFGAIFISYGDILLLLLL